MPVAASPRELWSSCNPDVLATVLTHLAAGAAERRGAEAAKHMLIEWLALLAMATSRGGMVDASFSLTGRLAMLPRLAFGLMSSPIVQPASHGQHPDLAAFVKELWLSLPPSELVTALYPRLSSWNDADTMAVAQHSLSRAALAACKDAPLLLLDTYEQLIIIRRQGSPVGMPFPPPKQSMLRGVVDGIRQTRRMTPHLIVLREEENQVETELERVLIDDVDGGFASLLQHVQQHAVSAVSI